MSRITGYLDNHINPFIFRYFARITLTICFLGLAGLNYVHQPLLRHAPKSIYLAKAGILIEQQLYEMAAPYLIEAKGLEKDTNSQVSYFAKRLLKLCHSKPTKADQPMNFQDFDSLVQKIDHFNPTKYEGKFRQIETTVQLFEAWTKLCKTFESRYYEQSCDKGERACGGLLKSSLEQTQEATFPALRMLFFKQLKDRLWQKDSIEVKLLDSAVKHPSLVLIHKRFAQKSVRTAYYNRIRPRTERLRFKSIIFQTGLDSESQVAHQPLSICEDWQVCLDCFEVEDAGDIVVLDFTDFLSTLALDQESLN